MNNHEIISTSPLSRHHSLAIEFINWFESGAYSQNDLSANKFGLDEKEFKK